MTDDVSHGAYVIHPTPRQPNGAGPWLAALHVRRVVDGGTRVQMFNAPGAYPTRDDAVAAGVAFGRAVIDGTAPDRAMLF